jgi:hypothetical protein
MQVANCLFRTQMNWCAFCGSTGGVDGPHSLIEAESQTTPFAIANVRLDSEPGEQTRSVMKVSFVGEGGAGKTL